MKRGSKQWWKQSKTLLHKATSNVSIPALRRTNGSWARSSFEKSNLLAETFQSKWILPSVVFNEFSDLPEVDLVPDSFIPLRTREACHFLESLDPASSTGPDLIGTFVLKRLASSLALPFCKLARAIV